LRRQFIAQRDAFVAGPGFEAAGLALGRHLVKVLSELEPQSLGLYWAYRSEFNAVAAVVADAGFSSLPLALPFAQRTPVQMHYRVWRRQPPDTVDECNIPTANGAPVVPDVVLAPCVAFTASGYRLGYGRGYFDRWLAQHPHVTAVGVAWSIVEVEAATLAPEPHDQPLTLIVTERGVV
jgi:5-formyltetrahydrofolate cyclo-ligase